MHRAYGFSIRLALLALIAVPTLFAAETADQPAVSSFASKKDILQQFDFFVDRIKKATKSEKSYSEKKQTQVRLDAQLISVLAQCMANHDSEFDEKANASSILEISSQIAEKSEDFAATQSLVARLASPTASKDAKAGWEPVAELSDLMQQVPVLHNNLKRGINSRRFTRSIEKTAGLATSLAAIAHVSMLDDSYCSDEEDKSQWDALCIEMRDLSAKISVAVHNKDQDEAKSLNEKLHTACNTCHKKFRD